MVGTKRLKKKISEIREHNHSYKAITYSDLDEYERMMYSVVSTVFANGVSANGTINDLRQPLAEVYRLITDRYLAANAGTEEFTIPDTNWNNLYIEAFTPWIDTFVPGLIDVLNENPDDLSKDRVMSIVTTETTRLTTVLALTMMLVYNTAIDAIWG